MPGNRKVDLILTTYELMKKEKLEDITIRSIAAASGCSSTIIYKYFDNVDHLVLLAAVRFLEGYVADLQDALNQNTDPWDIQIAMWRIFSRYAFENLEAFEMMFWGKGKEKLGDAIFEYYQYFPDKWQKLDGVLVSIFFLDDIQERNKVIIRRAAVMGYYKQEEYQAVSAMQCHLFYGVLMDYKQVYRQPGKAQEGMNCFLELLDSLVEHYRQK